MRRPELCHDSSDTDFFTDGNGFCSSNDQITIGVAAVWLLWPELQGQRCKVGRPIAFLSGVAVRFGHGDMLACESLPALGLLGFDMGQSNFGMWVNSQLAATSGLPAALALIQPGRPYMS